MPVTQSIELQARLIYGFSIDTNILCGISIVPTARNRGPLTNFGLITHQDPFKYSPRWLVQNVRSVPSAIHFMTSQSL